MNDVSNPSTGATRFLADIEHDDGLLHILESLDFAPAAEELVGADGVFDGVVRLGEWALNYPSATAGLLQWVARTPAVALKLVPVVLGCSIVKDGRLGEDADEILAAVFSELESPWRDAAADREGVRRRLDLPEGEGYEAVPPPDSSWLWPTGKPFPPASSLEGAQARLNYFELGCGPVNGEWNEPTRRAIIRWQIERGLTPTGSLDQMTIDDLAHYFPDTP